MGWSSTAPTLPSGESWGNTKTTSNSSNNFNQDLTAQSARGIGNTYYIKFSVYWTKGSNGVFSPYNPTYYIAGSDSASIGKPSEWSTVTRYYTGTASSSTTVKVGTSSSTSFISGWPSVTVSVAAPKYWTVSYNGNGADGGSTASQTKVSGTALTLRANGFTRTGFRFVEWNTAADGSGTSYAAGGSYTANAAVTLYAIWQRLAIPVYFNDNGTIKQATDVYYNDDGTIRKGTLYYNNNGTIIEVT